MRKKQINALSDTELVLVLSDLHMGKDNKNFSLEEAQKRLSEYPEKLAAHPGMPSCGNVSIILAGDIVEGEDIYHNQNSEIKTSTLDQTKAAYASLRILINKIAYNLRQCIEKINIYYVPGNHGRQSKTANKRTNWDNVVYGMLHEHYTNRTTEKGWCVESHINYDPFCIARIAGHNVLINHIGVRHLHTPATQKTFYRWMRRYNANFLVHGHWHRAELTPSDDCYRIANGSLCGPDDYGDSLGLYEPARQVFFAINKHSGIVAHNWVGW